MVWFTRLATWQVGFQRQTTHYMVCFTKIIFWLQGEFVLQRDITDYMVSVYTVNMNDRETSLTTWWVFTLWIRITKRRHWLHGECLHCEYVLQRDVTDYMVSVYTVNTYYKETSLTTWWVFTLWMCITKRRHWLHGECLHCEYVLQRDVTDYMVSVYTVNMYYKETSLTTWWVFTLWICITKRRHWLHGECLHCEYVLQRDVTDYMVSVYTVNVYYKETSLTTWWVFTLWICITKRRHWLHGECLHCEYVLQRDVTDYMVSVYTVNVYYKETSLTTWWVFTLWMCITKRRHWLHGECLHCECVLQRDVTDYMVSVYTVNMYYKETSLTTWWVFTLWMCITKRRHWLHGECLHCECVLQRDVTDYMVSVYTVNVYYKETSLTTWWVFTLWICITKRRHWLHGECLHCEYVLQRDVTDYMVSVYTVNMYYKETSLTTWWVFTLWMCITKRRHWLHGECLHCECVLQRDVTDYMVSVYTVNVYYKETSLTTWWVFTLWICITKRRHWLHGECLHCECVLQRDVTDYMVSVYTVNVYYKETSLTTWWVFTLWICITKRRHWLHGECLHCEYVLQRDVTDYMVSVYTVNVYYKETSLTTWWVFTLWMCITKRRHWLHGECLHCEYVLQRDVTDYMVSVYTVNVNDKDKPLAAQPVLQSARTCWSATPAAAGRTRAVQSRGPTPGWCWSSWWHNTALSVPCAVCPFWQKSKANIFSLI